MRLALLFAAFLGPHLNWGNDPGCRPSAAHPRPVILVHGAGATPEADFSVLGPRLHDAGFCVFALTYGVAFGRPGATPMEQSAQELKVFVDRVRKATGARKVDIVGHSEGTMMPRWYFDELDGAQYVDHDVNVAPLWRGTAIGGATALRDHTGPVGPFVMGLLSTFCGACPEILGGSAYLDELNADGEPSPGVKQLSIVTKYDSVVVPYTSGLMRGGGTNVVLQDLCPDDHADHVGLVSDPAVIALIQNALDDKEPPSSCPS